MCEGLSSADVGVSRDIVFQELRPGAVFDTGILLKKRWRCKLRMTLGKCLLVHQSLNGENDVLLQIVVEDILIETWEAHN